MEIELECTEVTHTDKTNKKGNKRFTRYKLEEVGGEITATLKSPENILMEGDIVKLTDKSTQSKLQEKPKKEKKK